ncbi:Holliday junction branch migration protein RuvA [Patescibacteria group bacterium]|nr:Holliday junction branch migration protein RuvA [Patescibacteria group bacterium]
MIAYLQGKIILKRDKFVILGVNDIGYKVFLSKKSILKVPETGQNLKLFCFQDIKETSQNLYGFFAYDELEFFEILNDIRGIGPKAAVEIASLGTLNSLKEKILNQDESMFAGISGIGQKKGLSIILELTGKIKNIKTSGDDAVDTLVSLGFSKQQAKDALSKVSARDPQERVRLALKTLGG